MCINVLAKFGSCIKCYLCFLYLTDFPISTKKNISFPSWTWDELVCFNQLTFWVMLVKLLILEIRYIVEGYSCQAADKLFILYMNNYYHSLTNSWGVNLACPFSIAISSNSIVRKTVKKYFDTRTRHQRLRRETYKQDR